MSVTDWPLDGDPSIRWQVMRDLDDRARAADVAAERARVEQAGAYLGVDVAPVVERILAERLDDGGWNCEAENGSVHS